MALQLQNGPRGLCGGRDGRAEQGRYWDLGCTGQARVGSQHWEGLWGKAVNTVPGTLVSCRPY